MSAPPRGRGASPHVTAARSLSRGGSATTNRGRGRGRGNASTSSPVNNGIGLLQKLRTGNANKPGNSEQNAGRGRGTTQRGGSNRGRGRAPTTQNGLPQSVPTSTNLASTPPMDSHKNFMAYMMEKFQQLKSQRESERKRAIQDGVLADPEKKTSLEKAITPVGTCEDMCPQFERVERTVQNMVDKAEKVSNEDTGRDMPSEERMVKRFRRSAAGYDEQLPSDIRTPETLKRTLDYLLDDIVGGGERLASIHKFVWDRTRGIRNDFSIQQVTKEEDVKLAVECYERIARFHILSLHQLCNPANLLEGENFDAHQEREQLNNTLLSLMYYYDDHRHAIHFPNEAEIKAYGIIFEMASLNPDLEDRIQSWPKDLLTNPRVQSAYKLFAAAGNTVFDQGPLKPFAPFSIAQANTAKFWSLLRSQEISYVSSCVAEINFAQVRFMALDAIWRSGKSAPQAQQKVLQGWTLTEVTNYLAFDDDDQTLEFCKALDLSFATASKDGQAQQCLDFTALSRPTLDNTLMPNKQIFSHNVVEAKRFHRTLVAVINRVSTTNAIRQGLVQEATNTDGNEQEEMDFDNDQNMFYAEKKADEATPAKPFGSSPFGSVLNPTASAFTPTQNPFGASDSKQENTPTWMTGFGQPRSSATPSAPPKSLFGNPSPFASVPAPSAPTGTNVGSMSASIGDLFRPVGSISEVAKPLSSSAFAPNQTSNPFGNITNIKPTTVSSPAVRPSLPLFGQSQTTQARSPTQDNLSKTLPNSNITWPPASATQQAATPGLTTNNLVPPTVASTAPTGLESQLVAAQKVPSITTTPFSPASTAAKPIFTFPSTTSVSANVSAPDSAKIAPQQQFPSQVSSLSSPINPKPAAQTSVPPPLSPQSTFPPGQQIGQLTPASTSGITATQQVARPIFSPPVELAANKDKTSFASFTFQSIEEAEHSFINDDNSNSRETLRSASPTSVRDTKSAQLATDSQRPVFSQKDRNLLVENTARLALVQRDGIIEHFVSNHVSRILHDLFRQQQQLKRDEITTRVKTRHLSRKFLSLWKTITDRKSLHRRAIKRRKAFAMTIRTEERVKQRKEAELEAIFEAIQVKKRIQEEQQRKQDQAEKETRPVEHEVAQPAQVGLQAIDSTSLAGRKRKSLSNNHSGSNGTPPNNKQTHKRTRTVGMAMSEPSTSLRISSPSRLFSPNRFGQSTQDTSVFSRSTSMRNGHRSTTNQKIDNTRTDYFRLKAMGIDPDTPLIPDTAQNLALRKEHQDAEKNASLAKITQRPSTNQSLSKSVMSMGPPPSLGNQISPNVQPPLPTASTQAPAEDDFLKQLREARAAMSEDAEWFKAQSQQLEKEILDQEERQQTMSQSQGSVDIPPASIDSFARTANGYEYTPPELKPGQTLSRTEQRIQRTGAYGLANRPIGGVQKSVYIPVAMSRQSAMKYSHGYQEVSHHKRESREIFEVNGLQTKSSEQIIKSKSMPDHKQQARLSMNPYDLLIGTEESDDDGDDGDEMDDTFDQYQNQARVDLDTELDEEDILQEDDSEEEHTIQTNRYIYPDLAVEERVYDHDGSEAGDEEEEDVRDDDDEDDEEEEIEEEDDDDSDDGQDYAARVLQYSRHTSRGTSGSVPTTGPGASADDALVLSD